jgi:hypothetical protein
MPHPNSTRGFVINPEERLVADGSYRLTFENSLLPEEDANATARRHTPAAVCRLACSPLLAGRRFLTLSRLRRRTIDWSGVRTASPTVPCCPPLPVAGGDIQRRRGLGRRARPYEEQAIEDADAMEFVEDFSNEARASVNRTSEIRCSSKLCRRPAPEMLDGAREIFRTIARLQAAAPRRRGSRFPLASGPVVFDTGELAVVPLGFTAAANRNTWSAPANLFQRKPRVLMPHPRGRCAVRRGVAPPVDSTFG